MVAQPDRVGEALEPDRVLGQPGDRQHPRNRAVRDDQAVVAQLVLGALLIEQRDRAPRRVAPDHDAQPQMRLLEHVAQRGDDVARLEHAGRRLGQERRVEQEVDVVDERDARALARHRALELAGRVEAAEPATGDDDVPGHGTMLLAGFLPRHARRAVPRARGPNAVSSRRSRRRSRAGRSSRRNRRQRTSCRSGSLGRARPAGRPPSARLSAIAPVKDRRAGALPPPPACPRCGEAACTRGPSAAQARRNAPFCGLVCHKPPDWGKTTTCSVWRRKRALHLVDSAHALPIL